MKKKIIVAAVVVLVLAIGFGAGALAAGGFGTASDPLITKSYLDEVLIPQLLEEYEQKLSDSVAIATDEMRGRIEELQAELDKYEQGGGSYMVVAMDAGDNLICGAGAEVMLRNGKAEALSELTDLTTGENLPQGDSLLTNHIYLVPSAGGGIRAQASAGLLVRGTYELN